MIKPIRRETLQALERLSELTPDVRFGQLIANLSYLAVGPTVEAIWEMEDDQLLAAIEQHIADLAQRQVNDLPAGIRSELASAGKRVDDWHG